MIKYIGAKRRKALGYTQSDLAKRCDVSTNTISSLERGQFLPSIELCFRLAAVLKLSNIEYLFEDHTLFFYRQKYDA